MAESENKSKQKGNVDVIPEYLPNEQSLIPIFEKWQKSNSPQEKDELALQIFRRHDFVREKKPQITEFPHLNTSVSVVGYILDVRGKFRKWMNSPKGRRFKKLAGGPSDDGLYTLSRILRETMPRGFHHVTFTHPDGETSFCFRGIPKFTGLEKHDEDEESNSTQVNFFYRGKKMKDASIVYMTEKSNGENAKFGVTEISGIRFLLAGSKNTCYCWPASEDSLTYHKDAGITIPAPFICATYSKWFRSLRESMQDEWFKMMGKYSTLMGEINCPWSEHIIPIDEMFVEMYCILDKFGKPIHVATGFELFQQFGIHHRKTGQWLIGDEIEVDGEVCTILSENGESWMVKTASGNERSLKNSEMPNSPVEQLDPFEPKEWIDRSPARSLFRHVFFEKYDASAMNELVESVRPRKDTEGAVIYICEEDGAVIGIVKVKASEYVVRRRIRERVRGGVVNIISGKKPHKFWDEAEENTRKMKKNLQSGMDKLSFIPNYKEMKASWKEFAVGFFEWWLEPIIQSHKNEESLKPYFLRFKHRLGSMYRSYEQTLQSKPA